MTCVVCIQLVNTIFLTWHEHMRKSWESSTGKETLSKASDNTCQPTMCHTLFVSILFTLQIIYHQKTKACTAIQNTHSYKIINISILSGSAVLTLDVHSVEGFAWNVALATENEVTPGAVMVLVSTWWLWGNRPFSEWDHTQSIKHAHTLHYEPTWH